MPTDEKFLCVHKRHLQDKLFSVNDALVLSLILDWKRWTGYVWGTNKQIGEQLGLCVATVGKSIRRLHGWSIITILDTEGGRQIIPCKDIDKKGGVIRKGGFVKVPWAIFKLPEFTSFDVLVYCELVSKAKQGYCFARNKV